MKNFLYRVGNKIRAFFYGRNGFDTLAKVAIIASIALSLICAFIPNGIIKLILVVLTWALMIYGYFRVLSRNIYKRVQENRYFRGEMRMIKTRWQQRKTHRFYRCKKCKTWLRVPRKKGKITITCVKCQHKFDKRT